MIKQQHYRETFLLGKRKCVKKYSETIIYKSHQWAFAFTSRPLTTQMELWNQERAHPITI